MAENNASFEAGLTLAQLTEQAKARWGADYVDRQSSLLEQAAQYITEIADNPPEAETEPGFYLGSL